MPKKFNDYYDHDNKVQYKPQTWECPKCNHQIQVLSAKDVSHKCPKNDKAVVFYKNLDKVPTKKATKKVAKKATKAVKKVEPVEKKVDNELSK